MTVTEQCKRLMLLLQELIERDNLDYVELLGEWALTMHPSLLKSYEIMTEHYLESRNLELYKKVENKLTEIFTEWQKNYKKPTTNVPNIDIKDVIASEPIFIKENSSKI